MVGAQNANLQKPAVQMFENLDIFENIFNELNIAYGSVLARRRPKLKFLIVGTLP